MSKFQLLIIAEADEATFDDAEGIVASAARLIEECGAEPYIAVAVPGDHREQANQAPLVKQFVWRSMKASEENEENR